MTTTKTLTWIRPWYPGLAGDHINADCPTLARETDTPTEGSGWLDPRGIHLCAECFAWNAVCQCGASLVQECGAGPHDGERAERWRNEHFCIPSIDLIPTPREPLMSTPSDNQPTLFALEPRA